jgi:hypothetical protein
VDSIEKSTAIHDAADHSNPNARRGVFCRDAAAMGTVTRSHDFVKSIR